MHPPLWQPPVELSLKEQEIISRIRHAKLFIFLRQIRHQLFDEHFQSELAQIYTDTAKGNPPIPPAQIALATILQAVESWLCQQPQQSIPETAKQSLRVARQIKVQDVVVATDGSPMLRRGVAKDRRITIEDPTMRHGRKSHSQKFNGYKRHVLTDLDLGIVRAVGLTPANVPEAWVSDAISADLKAQQVKLVELHIDRAYLSAKLVRKREEDLNIYCKAWPVHHRGGRFPKNAFVLDWQQQTLTCPNQVSVPLQLGKTIHFPKSDCDICPLRSRCTTNQRGRTVKIHPDERLLEELRVRQLTSSGRAKLRERVAVEHSLAHLGHWQGRSARYMGLRKNLFDLRRTAVVHNLHVIARHFEQSSTHSPAEVID